MADIHIRPLKYLDEMKFTFERLYKSLSQRCPDMIVISGDLFHSKLTVSSEYFEIAADFLKRLRSYAPVIVIPGNHDLSLNNKTRTDAISPVISAIYSHDLSINPITYSKKTESFSGFDSLDKRREKYKDFVFHHFSILDKKENWPTKEKIDESKINIALYHGSIDGCKFDNGWISRGNKDDITIFRGFDFALLGDIHIQQFLDNEKRVAYPGSLRQNNYGEGIDKGYLFWDIRSKNDFDVERVLLPQKRYFFTLYGSEVSDIQDIGDLQEGSRIRLQLTDDVDISEQLKMKSEIEKLYSPVNEVIIIPKSSDLDVGTIKVGEIDVLHENIRDPEVQKELIKEYFKDKNISEEDLQLLFDLDKIYHSHIETDVERNVIYKIKNMEWRNLFSYGTKNRIKFDKLNGLIGILGENGLGKSSIMDIFSLGLTNQIHKEGAIKNIDFINRRTKKADLKIDISMNNIDYTIEKSYEKKGKNEDNCLFDVEFYHGGNKKDNSLNGETKPDTNQNIRKKFGTYEDLNYKEICHQFGLTSFIDSRATKRKETLSKYFDLDVYSTKFNIAKKDFDDLKSRLKDYDYVKIQSEIEAKRIQIDSILRTKKDKMFEKDEKSETLSNLESELKSLYLQFVKTKYTNKDLHSAEIELRKIENLIDETEKKIEQKSALIKDFSYLGCSYVEYSELEGKLMAEIHKLRFEIGKSEALEKSSRKTSELLKQIPNVPQCKVCPLAKNAYEADEKIPDLVSSLDRDREELTRLCDEYNDKDFGRILNDWTKSEDCEDQVKTLSSALSLYLSQKDSIKEKIEDISKNLDEILLNEENQDKVDAKEKEIKDVKSGLRLIEESIVELSSQNSVLEYSVSELEKRLDLCEEMNKKKYIFELYLNAMGKDGISYWIISKKMPIINKQVNFILSHAVNFKLFIEDSEEEKKVKIHIVDEKGKRPIELASGMEKTISSIALRAALWNICLLPKTPVLMLDEAFSHLDNEHYDNIIKLLNYLKTFFDAILIITHDEALKSVMDNSFYITKDGKGYAQCKIN